MTKIKNTKYASGLTHPGILHGDRLKGVGVVERQVYVGGFKIGFEFGFEFGFGFGKGK